MRSRCKRLIGDLDQRRAMAALVVKQDERLVWRQTAQAERADEGRSILRDELLNVERRNRGTQSVIEVGRTLPVEDVKRPPK